MHIFQVIMNAFDVLVAAAAVCRKRKRTSDSPPSPVVNQSNKTAWKRPPPLAIDDSGVPDIVLLSDLHEDRASACGPPPNPWAPQCAVRESFSFNDTPYWRHRASASQNYMN
jgi:hypothetical protein